MSKILWTPTPERVADANLTRFLGYVNEKTAEKPDDFESLYEFSVNQPELFWSLLWSFSGVLGDPGEQILRNADQMPGAEFFPEARLNFAENLLRYRDEHTAISFHSELGQKRDISYHELYTSVARTAAALRENGIVAGDRVAAFMPNIPETVIAMLAATSIGAIWTSCSPDFGTAGVVDRIGQVEPRILFSVDAYSYNGKTHDCLQRVEEILSQVPSIETAVIASFLDLPSIPKHIPGAITWNAFTDNHATEIQFERLPFNHPVYILYSSGTTGVPKCITHGAGGTLLQHLKELQLHTDLKRDDRFFYFTTCGWMMWNWQVSGLAVGATLVQWEGSPFHPSPNALFDLVDEIGITVFGTGAKAISSWEKAGLIPRETHDLSSLRTLLSTGSVLAPESYDYVYRDIKQNICLSSISGGTDIVSCFAGGCPVLPVRRGELQSLGLGMEVQILKDDGQSAETGETGELCCMAPFPSMPVCFWGDEDGSKYRGAYFDKFPGVWAHGDFAQLTESGGVIIFGRSDATLNPGGVRIGTAEIYRQVEKLDEVIESICIGQDWEDDVRVILFVKLRDNSQLTEELITTIRNTIRSNTTPRHVPAHVLAVTDIPRTVSGKITELAVRDVVHGREVKNIDALANPESLVQFANRPELKT